MFFVRDFMTQYLLGLIEQEEYRQYDNHRDDGECERENWIHDIQYSPKYTGDSSSDEEEGISI